MGFPFNGPRSQYLLVRRVPANLVTRNDQVARKRQVPLGQVEIGPGDAADVGANKNLPAPGTGSTARACIVSSLTFSVPPSARVRRVEDAAHCWSKRCRESLGFHQRAIGTATDIAATIDPIGARTSSWPLR